MIKLMEMCLGIPGKVTKINGNQAKIKLPDHEHWVNTGMIKDRVKTGDYLLTYQEAAINKISPKQAKEILSLLKQTHE